MPAPLVSQIQMTGDSRIRILALLEANYVTGAAKSVLEFVREAAKQQTTFSSTTAMIFRRGPEGVNSDLTSACREIGLPFETIAERHVFDFGVLPQLVEAVERLRPTILWTNGVKSHFLVRWTGLARKVPWVAYHHGYTTTSRRTLCYNQLDRWSLRAASRVVTVCNPFAEELIGRGVPAERIRVQGMPIRCFDPVPQEYVHSLRARLGLSEGITVFLSVGRLSREKGHEDLLLAFSKLCEREQTPIRLLIAGDGPEQEKLSRLITELRISNKVNLVGHQNDIRLYYALADIFVLPSHSEGTPNSLLEAMSAGVPVVATSVGGVPEMSYGGTAVLLTPKRDVDGLAAALSRLLHDSELRACLTKSARTVLEKNTPERYFQALTAIFSEVLPRRA
jgi:glycosyltransferase involved in cell wall biosynthesis